MSKTLLIYDLSEKERCESMVKAFTIMNLKVHFFKNGAFRLAGKESIKQNPPKFDLVIQHRNDPLSPDIQFKRRVWYGGSKQTVAIKPLEEVIFRPILGRYDALNNKEAAQIVKYFFANGPKPEILEEFPPTSKNVDLINDFFKYCNMYLSNPPKTTSTLKGKISKLIQDLHLDPKFANDDEMIKLLNALIDCVPEKFRSLLNALKPKLFQRATEPSA